MRPRSKVGDDDTAVHCRSTLIKLAGNVKDQAEQKRTSKLARSPCVAADYLVNEAKDEAKKQGTLHMRFL